LDKVPGIDTLSQDLRDDETGRLDAKKMGGVVSGFGSGDREGGWDPLSWLTPSFATTSSICSTQMRRSSITPDGIGQSM
jgi:hypothetical protein